jgi:alpha 1,2-mannosyltransferase
LARATQQDASPQKNLTANTTERASTVVTTLLHLGLDNDLSLAIAPNSNLAGVVSSMTQFEEKFNRKFGYPYVFLNEVPFTVWPTVKGSPF